MTGFELGRMAGPFTEPPLDNLRVSFETTPAFIRLRRGRHAAQGVYNWALRELTCRGEASEASGGP